MVKGLELFRIHFRKLRPFLSSFPLDSGEWPAILGPRFEPFPRPPGPASLTGAIRSFFHPS
jgi:hypothetical protein